MKLEKKLDLHVLVWKYANSFEIYSFGYITAMLIAIRVSLNFPNSIITVLKFHCIQNFNKKVCAWFVKKVTDHIMGVKNCIWSTWDCHVQLMMKML